MAFEPEANGAYSVVAVAPSPATSGTTLSVSAGDGTLFPDPATVGAYNISVWPTNSAFTKANGEIVRVTAKTGDVLTITRNQESGTVRTIVVGDQIGQGVTKKSMEEITNRVPSVWLPAQSFTAEQAGTTLAVRGTSTANNAYMMPAWNLDDGGARTTDYLGTYLVLPAGFVGKVVTPRIHYSFANSNAGNWICNYFAAFMTLGQLIDRAADVASTVNSLASPSTVNYLGPDVALPTFTPTSRFLRFVIGRWGGNASDTLTGDVWFAGVELVIP